MKTFWPCISCCHCEPTEGHTLETLRERVQEPISCTVNARLGKEVDYPLYQPAQVRKKVVVVGGGPAGMETARVAALRGHQVTLYERGFRLGGAMILAAVVNSEVEILVKYMRREISKLPIQVMTGKELTPGMVDRIKPDVVVLATGGVAPETGGVSGKWVLTSHEILEVVQGHGIAKGGIAQRILWKVGALLLKYFYNPSLIRWLLKFRFPFGKNVIIIGGGLAGCELADLLVGRGKKVIIIGESTRVGESVEPTHRWLFRLKFREAGVRVIERAKVEEITDKGVKVSHDDSTEVLVSDTVVLSGGLQPSRELEDELKGKVPAIYRIGDCTEPAQIKEAITSGFLTGMEI